MPRKNLKKFKEFTPTSAQKKALASTEADFRKGKTLSYSELADALAKVKRGRSEYKNRKTVVATSPKKFR
ncbi:MAG: hypothetical protein Q7S28_02475 [bacterium]|nr:hypothetical protein [bacterium]